MARGALLSSAPAALGEMGAAVALRELARRDGRMAELCSENGILRMDWVDAVGALLADDRPLVELEELTEEWRRRGVRHVLWSGMGGSGVTVGLLAELELVGARGGPTVHLLDSTDPAALDAVVTKLAEGLQIPRSPVREDLQALLRDVVIVAVSLGLTSEEPATHLSWFLSLLAAAGLPPERHALVLTVAGSRLEEAARLRGLEARPVLLANRGGVPGRMSAPATSVFLLPLALRVAATAGSGLRAVLEEAWLAHDLAGTVENPARSPYVRLAAEIAARARGGSCRLMLELPRPWAPMRVWIEQLLEQTLGKDGKGVVVLPPQRLNPAAIGYCDDDLVVATTRAEDGVAVPLPDPSLEPPSALAAAMLGWQLTAALLGHRAGTNIVDEPAVEEYKSRARVLRGQNDVLARAVEEGAVDWNARGPAGLEPLIHALVANASRRRLAYLDLTVNGELDPITRQSARVRLGRLGNERLGVPVKLRRAPAAYHISEQCQLDGPPGIVSLRVVARAARPVAFGNYTPQFLHAQAVATWRAMNARCRDCALVVLDRLGEVDDLLAAIEGLVRARLELGLAGGER